MDTQTNESRLFAAELPLIAAEPKELMEDWMMTFEMENITPCTPAGSPMATMRRRGSFFDAHIAQDKAAGVRPAHQRDEDADGGERLRDARRERDARADGEPDEKRDDQIADRPRRADGGDGDGAAVLTDDDEVRRVEQQLQNAR